MTNGGGYMTKRCNKGAMQFLNDFLKKVNKEILKVLKMHYKTPTPFTTDSEWILFRLIFMEGFKMGKEDK